MLLWSLLRDTRTLYGNCQKFRLKGVGFVPRNVKQLFRDWVLGLLKLPSASCIVIIQVLFIATQNQILPLRVRPPGEEDEEEKEEGEKGVGQRQRQQQK